MKNYIQPGNTLDFTAAADLSAGTPALIGSLFGVVCNDVKNGEQGQLALAGVYTMPKTSANTPSQYDKAYWNDANGEVTTTASGNKLIGVFVEAAAAGTTVASVRLNGIAV